MKIKAETGGRLDIFLADFLSVTRNRAKSLILSGKVKVYGRPAKPSYAVQTGDIIEVETPAIQEECEIKPKNIPLNIVYEDDDLIVLNKQKGLICHPTAYNKENTLVNALLFHTNKLSDIDKTRPGIVHRLDCDTSGLMLVAKNNSAHKKLQADIRDKKTVRKYLAVCHGVIQEDSGIINKPLVHFMGKTVKMHTANDGLTAVTKFKVRERYSCATFLELELLTGRTHQIRCHLSSAGHPCIGDKLYGAGGFASGAMSKLKTTGQVLMSYYLCFTHPSRGEIMEFEIKEDNFDTDLKKTLKFLRSMG